jgi:hypothetical protein
MGTQIVYAVVAGALAGGLIWFIMKKDSDPAKAKAKNFAVMGGIAAAVGMWILR